MDLISGSAWTRTAEPACRGTRQGGGGGPRGVLGCVLLPFKATKMQPGGRWLVRVQRDRGLQARRLSFTSKVASRRRSSRGPAKITPSTASTLHLITSTRRNPLHGAKPAHLRLRGTHTSTNQQTAARWFRPRPPRRLSPGCSSVEPELETGSGSARCEFSFLTMEILQ